MDNQLREEIIEMFIRKRDLMHDMLNATKSTVFYGNEEDAQVYINLIEHRQDNIDEMKDIDNILKDEPYATFLKTPTQDIEDIIYSAKHAISVASEEIIELDKANGQNVNRIMAILKKEMKTLKESKNMNSLYNNTDYQLGGNRFDTKK